MPQLTVNNLIVFLCVDLCFSDTDVGLELFDSSNVVFL